MKNMIARHIIYSNYLDIQKSVSEHERKVTINITLQLLQLLLKNNLHKKFCQKMKTYTIPRGNEFHNCVVGGPAEPMYPNTQDLRSM
jgi:hypothetical protein